MKHCTSGREMVWPPERWQRAQDMRADGFKVEGIARALGLTAKQVQAKFTNEHHAHRASTERLKMRDALNERDGRMAALSQRSLTQIIDGYSAIDQKQKHPA